MSKVHKSTLFNLVLKAEDRLEMKNHPEILGPYGYDIHIPARDVLDLCADSERLRQLERLADCIERADTDGIRMGAAAMEQDRTSKFHEYDTHCSCSDCMNGHHAKALRKALEAGG